MAKKASGKIGAIKPSRVGSLRRITKTKAGHKVSVAKMEQLKRSGTPAEKKKANFALNARKWAHK